MNISFIIEYATSVISHCIVDESVSFPVDDLADLLVKLTFLRLSGECPLRTPTSRHCFLLSLFFSCRRRRRRNFGEYTMISFLSAHKNKPAVWALIIKIISFWYLLIKQKFHQTNRVLKIFLHISVLCFCSFCSNLKMRSKIERMVLKACWSCVIRSTLLPRRDALLS